MSRFLHSLKNHPGVQWAAFFSILGFAAGLQRSSIKYAMVGAALMSIYWIPVLWTAYTNSKYLGRALTKPAKESSGER